MQLLGVSLGAGNSKVGDVWTFSLPSQATCPGASPWCLKHCYAKRYERLRPVCRRAYERNLALTQDPDEFVRVMTGTLPRILPCFRIHVGGDFHDVPYTNAWRRICSAFPQTKFWAYTRGWAVDLLRPALERLMTLSNATIFASTDPSMPMPPANWRVAFVETDPRASGMQCREQNGQTDSCLSCGYCFNTDSGNVVFNVH